MPTSKKPTTADTIKAARQYLEGLKGHVFTDLELTKPPNIEAALDAVLVISKLSPMLGNVTEFKAVRALNDSKAFDGGKWERQDPGFPDVIFRGAVDPAPGFEVKAWYPFATEITGRFRDSQNHFNADQTYVAMLAWLPEHLVYGRPRVLDVCVVSGASIAKARDDHYHNPPDYIVLEPEDTKARARNLQQTNTAGYKCQESNAERLAEAAAVVKSWGDGGAAYLPTAEYQARLRDLTSKFKYRLDTNYAKMDRVVHAEIETFKTRVLATQLHGLTVSQWGRLFNRRSLDDARKEITTRLGIGAPPSTQAQPTPRQTRR